MRRLACHLLGSGLVGAYLGALVAVLTAHLNALFGAPADVAGLIVLLALTYGAAWLPLGGLIWLATLRHRSREQALVVTRRAALIAFITGCVVTGTYAVLLRLDIDDAGPKVACLAAVVLVCVTLLSTVRLRRRVQRVGTLLYGRTGLLAHAMVLLAALGAAVGVYRARRGVPAQRPALHVDRTAPLRVVVLGLDAAHWGVIDHLIDQGELPNFARLKREGAWATLQTLRPTISPLIWTTIATGMPPEIHGIVDFVETRVALCRSGLQRVPHATFLPHIVHAYEALGLAQIDLVSSRTRRVPALWNLATLGNRRVAVIGYWASWPAEPVYGLIVSDHANAAYLREMHQLGLRDADHWIRRGVGLTFPDSLYSEIRPQLAAPLAMTWEQMGVDATDRAMQAFPPVVRADVERLRNWYTSDVGYERVADALQERGPFDLFILYQILIDRVQHKFWRFYDPNPELYGQQDPELVHALADVVRAAYTHADNLLGRYMRRVGQDTVLVVVSDHGVSPQRLYVKKNTSASHNHAEPGILVFWGPAVRSGVEIANASVYDVAPTILACLGLPKSDEMPGRVLREAFVEPVARRFPTYTVRSYGRRTTAAGNRLSDLDERIIQELRALGYLD